MSLARDVTTVGSGTLVSRLLGYIRDAGIAALLGTGPVSDAFFAVLQVVNFFRRLLAEGALNAAFVPIWLGLRGGEDGAANADKFTVRSLLAVFCLTGIVALLIIVFANGMIGLISPGFDDARRNVAAFFLLIVAPYIVLAGLVAVLAAALNAENRVVAVALSTIAFNLVMLLVLAWAFAGSEPLAASIWLAIAVVAAGLTQLVITGAVWLATGRRWQRVRARVPDRTPALFMRAGPGLIAAGIPQLKLIAAAAIVSSSPAAVSWLYYANRLYELPLGIASIAIAAVIVPRIAASLRDGEAHEFAGVQSRAFEIALGLALPAAAGFALLAQPIAGVLFERGAFGPQDTLAVAAALTAICAGLPGHVLEKVLGAVSFAQGDTHTPMLAALCGLAAAIVGGVLLFPLYGHVGVAAAIAVSGWVGAVLMTGMLYARGWLRLDAAALHRLPRIIVATVIMSLAVGGGLMLAYAQSPVLQTSAAGRLAVLAVLISLGVALYLAALQGLGVVRLKHLIAAIRRKG
ncbi:MAG: murein biosynthesis integral membrane protein MurJ [Pseudolabrys sp.]|nr:murein biosynthesis integral membrane protein MurJ [Pseudolabrys sp.]